MTTALSRRQFAGLATATAATTTTTATAAVSTAAAAATIPHHLLQLRWNFLLGVPQ